MIIIRVMGGLGNQLQQYALFRKFQSLGVKAKLDLSWFSQKTQESAAAPRKFTLSDFEGASLETASAEEVRALLGRAYEDEAGLSEKLKKRLMPGKCRCSRNRRCTIRRFFLAGALSGRLLGLRGILRGYSGQASGGASLSRERRCPKPRPWPRWRRSPPSASTFAEGIIWTRPMLPCLAASVRRSIMTLVSII